VVTATCIDLLARSTFDLFGIVKRIVEATAWANRRSKFGHDTA
jgi:hypothetical protein